MNWAHDCTVAATCRRRLCVPAGEARRNTGLGARRCRADLHAGGGGAGCRRKADEHAHTPVGLRLLLSFAVAGRFGFSVCCPTVVASGCCWVHVPLLLPVVVLLVLLGFVGPSLRLGSSGHGGSFLHRTAGSGEEDALGPSLNMPKRPPTTATQQGAPRRQPPANDNGAAAAAPGDLWFMTSTFVLLVLGFAGKLYVPCCGGASGTEQQPLLCGRADGSLLRNVCSTPEPWRHAAVVAKMPQLLVADLRLVPDEAFQVVAVLWLAGFPLLLLLLLRTGSRAHAATGRVLHRRTAGAHGGVLPGIGAVWASERLPHRVLPAQHGLEPMVRGYMRGLRVGGGATT